MEGKPLQSNKWGLQFVQKVFFICHHCIDDPTSATFSWLLGPTKSALLRASHIYPRSHLTRVCFICKIKFPWNNRKNKFTKSYTYEKINATFKITGLSLYLPFNSMWSCCLEFHCSFFLRLRAEVILCAILFIMVSLQVLLSAATIWTFQR